MVAIVLKLNLCEFESIVDCVNFVKEAFTNRLENKKNYQGYI